MGRAVHVVADVEARGHAGKLPARAIQALFTVYSYTIGFTIEEQAVYPTPGERDERYVFENGELRFEDGLATMMLGIKAWL